MSTILSGVFVSKKKKKSAFSSRKVNQYLKIHGVYTVDFYTVGQESPNKSHVSSMAEGCN